MGSRQSALDARTQTLRALDATDAEEIAEAFTNAQDALAKVCRDENGGTTAKRVSVLKRTFGLVGLLYTWDVAIVNAEPDADRYLRSAVRQAVSIRSELATSSQRTEWESEIDAILLAIERVESPTEIDPIRTRVGKVKVPLAAIPEARRFSRTSSDQEADDSPTRTPRAVCLLSLDGALVDNALRVRRDRIHSLDVLVRVLDWPRDLSTLRINFVSVWDPATIEAPSLELERPEGDSNETLAVEGRANVVLHASSDEPISLTLQAILTGLQTPESLEIEVLGYTQLLVRPFDAALDAITGNESIDERLHQILTDLHGKVPDLELEAFSRFFSSLARAAAAIQADNVFRRGRKVREDDFQKDLETRLRADATLGGRITRVEKAGGITDLTHDGITCELKVEGQNAVTSETLSSFIGQPVQYASGDQRQLSILCVLDMSPKSLPPGALAENIGLVSPATHSGSAAYVGTLVVPGDFDIPSSWSGKSIPDTNEAPE